MQDLFAPPPARMKRREHAKNGTEPGACTELRARLLKNAAANLSRGGVTAAVALLLPPILVRHMAPAAYAVWVLALQAAAYMGYLDFGLQTAVGRYIAYANEKHDDDWRDAVFTTAFSGLTLAGILGAAAIAIIAAAARPIFSSVPQALLMPLQTTILIVGLSVAAGLPASAWNGVFVGMQRFDIPAIILGLGRVLSAAGVALCALTGRSLLTMALVMAIGNLLTNGAQYAFFHRLATGIRFRLSLVRIEVVRELAGYCGSLTVWSFAMLLINGFDLLLVGHFQFSAVPPYAVSATLITFLAGLQNAIFGVLMPHAAQMHARNDAGALGTLLLRSTKLGVLLLLTGGLPLIVCAAPLLHVWVGQSFVQSGAPILTILVVANMLRLTGTPYASILIGTGQQRLILVSPLLEGFTNLFFSILLGMKIGAMGVALGTLIGAFVVVMANIFYNIPRTQAQIRISRWNFAASGLLWPALFSLPVCLAELPRLLGYAVSPILTGAALLMSLAACLWGLMQSWIPERDPSHPSSIRMKLARTFRSGS